MTSGLVSVSQRLAPAAAVLLLLGALAVLTSEYLNCVKGINRDDFLCVDQCQDVLDGLSG